MQLKLLQPSFVKNYLITALLLQMLTLMIWCFIPNSTTLILAIIIGLAAFLLTLFSHKRILILLTLYIAIIPSSGWGQNYPFFKIFVSYYVILGLLALAIAYKLLRNAFEDRQRESLSLLDKLVLVFLFWTTITGLYGYLRGFSSGYLFVLELLYVFFYGSYFLIDASDTDKRWILIFYDVLVMVTVVISFEFIAILLQTFQKGMLARIVTRQPHLALFAFPYMLSTIIMSPSTKRRIISLLALLPVTLMITISQQRALWIGIALSSFVLLFMLRHRKWISRKVFASTIIAGAALLIIAVQFLIRLTGTQVITTFGMRIFSLLALEMDLSWTTRTGEILIAFNQLRNINFLTGTGFGSTILRLAAPVYSEYLDNSFAQLIWKMGIIGFSLYIAIIIIFLKRCLYLYRKIPDTNVKIIGLSCFSGFIGLLFVGLTNRVLVGYRFIIVWALLIASIEILYKKIVNQKDNATLHEKQILS